MVYGTSTLFTANVFACASVSPLLFILFNFLAS